MPADDADVFEADLPLVRREFPWPIRVGCVAAGAFAVVMPLWELGHGLWPLNIATPVFAVIIGGAGYVGIQFVRAGLSGWGDVWTYPPGEVRVQRRAWGRAPPPDWVPPTWPPSKYAEARTPTTTMRHGRS